MSRFSLWRLVLRTSSFPSECKLSGLSNKVQLWSSVSSFGGTKSQRTGWRLVLIKCYKIWYLLQHNLLIVQVFQVLKRVVILLAGWTSSANPSPCHMNSSPCHLNWTEKTYCPHLRLIIWSRETDSADPSCASPLTLHVQADYCSAFLLM